MCLISLPGLQFKSINKLLFGLYFSNLPAVRRVRHKSLAGHFYPAAIDLSYSIQQPFYIPIAIKTGLQTKNSITKKS